MSQHDLDIANQGFSAFRTDLNNALVALGSTNSGTSAPSAGTIKAGIALTSNKLLISDR